MLIRDSKNDILMTNHGPETNTRDVASHEYKVPSEYCSRECEEVDQERFTK